MNWRMTPDQALLTSAEVAKRFRVGRSAVVRWVEKGQIEAVRTPGGHLRFRAADIEALIAGSASARAVAS